MEVMQAIRDRRSIRDYQDRPVPDESLHSVLEAGRLAPSSSNVQSWKFKVVTSQNDRAALREAAANQAFVEKAPIVIVTCLDLEAFGERAQGIVESLKKEEMASTRVAGLFGHCNSPDEERCLIHAFMNVAIAVENMALQATSEGLGTCWVRAFDPALVSKILSLPPEYPPAVLLPLGYPAERPPQRARKAIEDILL